LTKKQFKHDFLRGLGSALLELKTCENPQQYYDIVHYGCLHNTTYDMQCEGDRGWYLYQAAQIVAGDDILKNIIARYARSFNDDWLFDQLTSILYNFAEDGSEDARATLYDKYTVMLEYLTHINVKTRQYRTSPDRDMFDWLCVWLTSLDGWSAFKRIVTDVSEKLLLKDTEFFFSEWFYDNSKGKFGEKRIEKYLQKQSEKSAFIRAYYETAQAWDKRMYADERPVPTIEQVLAAADGQEFRGRGIAMSFARTAKPEDIEKLALAAMNETNIKIQLELLWPFRRTADFPFPEEFLLKLRESGDEKLRDIAFDIMGRNPSEKTHNLALSLIKSGEDIENGVSLLAKNLRPADETLLYEAVKSFSIHRNEWAWHSIFTSARDGIEAMRGKPKTDILEYLYRYTLCGSCREWIVRLMHKKKVLPEKILQECRFDSNSDIREFAARIKS